MDPDLGAMTFGAKEGFGEASDVAVT